MKYLKLFFKLNTKYIKFNKSYYTTFFISVFLSVFLVTSIFIVQDSYNSFTLNNSKYVNGSWDIKYSGYYYNQILNDEERFELDQSQDEMLYVKLETANYKEKSITLNYVSKFNSLLAIHLTHGKYPMMNNEILVEKKFADNNEMNIGDDIEITDEYGKIIKYKITGTYNKVSSQVSDNFYTFFVVTSDDIENTEVYATVTTLDNYQIYQNEVDEINTNDYYSNIKFYGNKLFNLFMNILIIFIFGSSLLLLLNSTMIHLNNKELYLKKLLLIGVTNKQINLLLVLELFWVYTISFVVSFITTLGFWNIVIWLGQYQITKILQSSIPIDIHLSMMKIISIIILLFCTFIISFLIAIILRKKTKQRGKYFRSWKLKRLPITIRLGILDLLRKRYGLLICIALSISSVVFVMTQYVVESLITNYSNTYNYSSDIEINFVLTEKTVEDFSTFLDNYEQICKMETVEDCTISYSVNANINNMLEDESEMISFTNVDNDYLTKLEELFEFSEAPYIVISNEVDQNWIGELLDISVFNESLGSEVGRLSARYNFIGESAQTFGFSTDTVVITSKKNIENLIREYPNAAIIGSMSFDPNESGLEIMNEINARFYEIKNDKYYIIDNTEIQSKVSMQENSIRIVSYLVSIIISLCSFFTIANLQLSYYISREKEIILFNMIGMNTKEVYKQFYSQMIIYTIISFGISTLISVFLINILTSMMNLETDYFLLFILQVMIFMIITILTLFITKTILKKITKKIYKKK